MANSLITDYRRVDSLSLEGNGVYPLVSASITWGVDVGTVCQVAPVIGERILPSSGSVLSADNLPPDQRMQVSIGVDGEDPVVIHTGYPINNNLRTASGAAPNSSVVARNITLNSPLGTLSSINPGTRFFFAGPSTPSARLLTTELLTASNDGSSISFMRPGKDIDEPNPAQYIIEVLSRFQEAHLAAGEQKAALKVKDILSSKDSYTLNEKITANGKVKVGKCISDRTTARATAWHSSTLYNCLLDFNAGAFLHIVPLSIEDGTFLVGPTLPVYNGISKTLSLKEILSLSESQVDVEGLEPVTQVWVSRQIGTAEDALANPSIDLLDTALYHRYPPEINKGQALLKQVPPLFADIVNQHLNLGGTGNEQTGVNTVGIKTTKTEDKAKAARDAAEDPRKNMRSQEEVDQLGVQIAKMYYADRVFNVRNVNISVPWHMYSEMVGLLGHNIQFTIPFQTGSNVGNLSTVTLAVDRPSNSAICSLSLTYCRTLEENSDTDIVLTEHPLYDDFIGKEN